MTTPTFKECFSFPFANAGGRKEILIGGLLLFIPIWGWIMNLGHRIVYTRKMYLLEPPFPSWHNIRIITKHGLITLVAMTIYHLPAIFCFVLAYFFSSYILWIVGAIFWLSGTLLVPGFMTQYCKTNNWKDIYKPVACANRIVKAGRSYWHAWLIVLSALVLSFTGLIVFVFGFFFASVWFWQVAAYAFFTVFKELD